MIVILWSASSEKEAKTISRGLIEKRYAACSSMIPKVVSIYGWDGKINESSEVLVAIKTRPEKYADVERYIIENSAYDTPEIAEIKVTNALPAYLSWLKQMVDA